MIDDKHEEVQVPLDALEGVLKLLARKEEETRDLVLQMRDLQLKVAELEGRAPELEEDTAQEEEHRGRRLLVVDSSEAFLKEITGILDKAGFLSVDISRSGRRAIELVSENDYDLIFLDYQLRDISGVETLKEMRSLRPDAKIVIVTGEALKSHILGCISAGADDFISKPITAGVFIRRVLRCLSS